MAKKTESDLLYDLAERVGELERANAAILLRLSRYDKLFEKLGELVKIDLELATSSEVVNK